MCVIIVIFKITMLGADIYHKLRSVASPGPTNGCNILLRSRQLILFFLPSPLHDPFPFSFSLNPPALVNLGNLRVILGTIREESLDDPQSLAVNFIIVVRLKLLIPVKHI